MCFFGFAHNFYCIARFLFFDEKRGVNFDRPLPSPSAQPLRQKHHRAGDNEIMNLQLHALLASDGPVVARIRERLPQTMAVYAFGSQVQGTANAQSDLDLAVLVAGYADPLVLWALAGELSDTVACPVDLLDLRAASTVMQYQVIMGGQCLWSAGLPVGLFECYVLSEKTALEEARAPLMADIKSTGTIYGR
jgi:predicted nucleotidyltransferase